MDVIYTQGSPREIGRQIGELLGDRIATAVDNYTASPEFSSRLPTFVATAEQHTPDIMAEIDGIADVTGFSPDQLWQLNFKIVGQNADVPPLGLDRCSNVVFPSGPDGPLLGRNLDLRHNGPNRADRYVTVVRHPSDGIPTMSFHRPGTFGRAGTAFNRAGVAIGDSSVGSRFQQRDEFIQARMWILHTIMQSRSAAEFIERLASQPMRGKGYNVPVVDRFGDGAAIEAVCPFLQVREFARRDAGCAVNRYQLDQLADADQRSAEGKQNANDRIETFREAFEEQDDRSVEGMKAILRQHAEEGDICRHGEAGSYTQFSTIAMPERNELHIAFGNPCDATYTAIQFEPTPPTDTPVKIEL